MSSDFYTTSEFIVCMGHQEVPSKTAGSVSEENSILQIRFVSDHHVKKFNK